MDYLKERSPQGARNVLARIESVEKLLAQFPLSGSQTRLSWLRRIAVTPYPYLIFYEVTEEEVVVHAVRHTARKPSSMPDG